MRSAPELLRSWLRLRHLTQRDLAKILGVGESAIYQWTGGNKRPSLDAATAIERLSEGLVPATSWADQARVEEAVARARSIGTGGADSSGA